MKLARLFLAVLTISTLAACGNTVTGPQAEPEATPTLNTSCSDTGDTTTCRTGQTGSGG